jgi:hypothetical protein
LRGYIGWLITNARFLKERNELFARWQSELERNGIPQSGETFLETVPPSKAVQRITSDTTKRFLDAFAQFYARWRLVQLVTGELPEPLAPQIPVRTPLALLSHMEAGGVTLYQPDTVPVPPRDTLRDVLEDVRIGNENAHLGEWITVVRKGRANNESITRFERLLVLHHYWTVLQQRHPGIFRRNTGRIQDAFADFLHVSPRAIEKDRQLVRKRLNVSGNARHQTD